MTAAVDQAPARTTAALSLAVVSGALVAAQSRVNGQLALALDDALLAAVVSFGSGLVLVAAVVACRPSARRALAAVRTVPWWSRLGGLGGATLVAVAATAAPLLGVAVLTVGIVAGQTSGGILVDRVGLGPGGRRPATAPRLLGALLCLGAVGLSAAGGSVRDADPLLVLLVVVAGFLIALQQAVNGRVRAATGDAFVATLVNFCVGTAALLVGLLVHVALAGVPESDWPGPTQAWLYAGGAIGVFFIAVAAAVVRVLGVLRLGLASVAGQLVGAVLLDATAPLPGAGVEALTVLAAALTVVAVAVAGRGSR